jgi:hypothetical protein
LILTANIGPETGVAMPSLFRFFAAVGLLGGCIYAGMFALANWYDPKPREISVVVPPDKFSKQR